MCSAPKLSKLLLVSGPKLSPGPTTRGSRLGYTLNLAICSLKGLRASRGPYAEIHTSFSYSAMTFSNDPR